MTKPLAAVSEDMGLRYPLTQIGIRKTFDDLMHATLVDAIVTRATSRA